MYDESGDCGENPGHPTGTVLHKALAAAELLEAKGIQARVGDMHTIKPIDRDLIVACAEEKMCIRDSFHTVLPAIFTSMVAPLQNRNRPIRVGTPFLNRPEVKPVSYTHLTSAIP